MVKYFDSQKNVQNPLALKIKINLKISSFRFMIKTFILFCILSLQDAISSITIQEFETNHFSILSDKLTEFETLTSFTFDSNTLQTLSTLSQSQLALTTQDLNSAEIIDRVVIFKECEQALVIRKNQVLCKMRDTLVEISIRNKELQITQQVQGVDGQLVAVQQQAQSYSIDAYIQKMGKTKCITLDSPQKCKTSITEITQIINKNLNRGPIILKQNLESSLLIVKQNKDDEIITKNLKIFQEPIASHQGRILGNAPNFTTVPGIINITLGSTYVLVFPPIDDENNSTVTLNVSYPTIPYMQNNSISNYTFSPPLNAFSLINWTAGASKPYNITVNLTDNESKNATFNFTIIYTNSAPYFNSTPNTSLSTGGQPITYQFPILVDDEGHNVTLKTNLNAASPIQSKIKYNSTSNSFIVTPSLCDTWTSNFSYWLTDNDLNSTNYTMMVNVTMTPPKFKSPPILQPLSNPYKMHLMGNLTLNMSSIQDIDGHTFQLKMNDTTPNGVTPLNFTFNNNNGILTLKSNNSLDAGPMNSMLFNGSANHSILLQVIDQCNLSTNYSIMVEVSNTAPQFFPKNITVPKVEIYLKNNITIDLSQNITDIDNDKIIMELATMDGSSPRIVPSMFRIAQPASIIISPRNFSDVRNYRLRVEIYDYRPYQSFLYFDVIVMDKAPIFLNQTTTLITQKIRFNTTFEFRLPAYSDAENDTVYVNLDSIPNNLNSFAQPFPQLNPDRIIINPIYWNQLNLYQVAVKLTDQMNSTSYQWQLEIFNTPPYFDGNQKPANQKIRFNETAEYTLPKFSDDEKNPVDVITSLPSFITFDKKTSKYTISPSKPRTDIGTVNINGKLTDYNMQTEFKFTVTVFNDPPYFKQALVQSITVQVGSSKNYTLPAPEDKENMPIKITVKMKDEDGPLPKFIKFSEATRQFEFSPDLLRYVGQYEIDVFLDDGYSLKSRYRFRLNIEDPNKSKFQSATENLGKSGTKFNLELIQGSFKIIEVTRDGKCTIKIFATKGAEFLTKEVNSETFQIAVVTKKDQPVKYVVDSKNIALNTVTLQLVFNNSRKISSSTEKDRIELRVDKSPDFKNQKMLCFLPFNLKHQAFVPPQVSKAAASAAATFKGGVELISSTAVPGAMVINLSITFVIQYFWGLLNDMSFLTINAMISLSVPGTAKLIQIALLNFIYLDILFTDKWLFPLLFKEENENQKEQDNSLDDEDGEIVDPAGPLNDFFDENGFSSKYLIENLGSTFVYMILLVSVLLLIPLLLLFESLCSSVKKLSLFLKKHMIWNVTLRFIIQQAPPISIACGINLYLLNFDKLDGRSASSVLSLFFIIKIFIAKIVVFVLLRKYQKTKQLQSEYFTQRYGTLVEGLNLETNIGVYWNLLVLIRWSLTNMTLILFRDYNYAEILFLLILSYFYQILLIVGRPFNDKLENKISLFNEFSVSAYLYILMMLTDYLGENQFREQQGIVLVVIILANVSVNFLKLICNITLAIIQYCRKKRRIKEFEEANRLEQLKKEEIQQRQEDIERYFRYNPNIFQPDYIPTPEEEQMMEERRKYLLINPSHQPSQKSNTASRFNQVLNNWSGVNQTKSNFTRDPIMYNNDTCINNMITRFLLINYGKKKQKKKKRRKILLRIRKIRKKGNKRRSMKIKLPKISYRYNGRQVIVIQAIILRWEIWSKNKSSKIHKTQQNVIKSRNNLIYRIASCKKLNKR